MRTSLPRRLLAGLVVLAAVGASAAAPAQAADPVGGPNLGRSDVIVDLGPKARSLPEVYAAAWLIADADTGEILAAKAPHLQRAPASTLKTLTAITVLPQIDRRMVYTATDADANVEGSRVGIVPGATYTVDDLLHGLFLPSGNDAASAVANANGGWKKTIKEMNATAKRLQAFDTVAKNPSGLDADGQVSSAYDLALIAREGLRNVPAFREYAATVSAAFPGAMPAAGQERETYKIYTQNRLLLHGFEGAIGVKTGYTTNAGRTFIGAAERDGVTLIVTFLGITESTETAASKLLDWGFANAERVNSIGQLVEPVEPTTKPKATATADPSEVAVAASTSSDSGPGIGTIAIIALGLLLGGFLVILGIGRAVRPAPAPTRGRRARR